MVEKAEIKMLDNLKVIVRIDEVLKWLDCSKDSPAYKQLLEEYLEIESEAINLLRPTGILGLSQIPLDDKYGEYGGKKAIYTVISVGRDISYKSSQYFKNSEYMKGMICDAIADIALFSLDEQVKLAVKQFSFERKYGVLTRIEAPQDIPMQINKEAWNLLELKKYMDVNITSGLMFDPVKTSCNIFILTDDLKQCNMDHDCSKCPNVNCKMRNIKKVMITVLHNGEEIKFSMDKGRSLMEGFIDNNIYINAPCGGKGRCGKCKVLVKSGNTDISNADRSSFTSEELKEGYRLSCTLYPNEDLIVGMEEPSEEKFDILIDTGKDKKDYTENLKNIHENEFEIAVDIGTTTIVAVLLESKSHMQIAVSTRINSQRQYGADVISRIQTSCEGKGDKLQECILSNLKELFTKLANEGNISLKKVTKIVIAGNTTMIHLLMGYSCKTLGVYPFTPVNIDFIYTDYKDLFKDDDLNAKIVILPSISTYVGGDIVSGLYAMGFDRNDKVSILVDLGTNGEMAIGNKDGITVTSTAAGPAFEGGNITCGVGSIAGAISKIDIDNNVIKYKTIFDDSPVGICGTGVIEILSELVEHEIVDETGMMSEEFFDDGYEIAKTKDGKSIVFTQRDVRELQLAKSAIVSGIEILLKRFDISPEKVDKLYIAGGFGFNLNIEKAFIIGMIPKSLRGKTEVVGNSSLSGTKLFLTEEDAIKRVSRIKDISREIELSKDNDFMNLYVCNMTFE